MCVGTVAETEIILPFPLCRDRRNRRGEKGPSLFLCVCRVRSGDRCDASVFVCVETVGTVAETKVLPYCFMCVGFVAETEVLPAFLHV